MPGRGKQGLVQRVANEELTVEAWKVEQVYKVFLQEHVFYEFVRTKLYCIL